MRAVAQIPHLGMSKPINAIILTRVSTDRQEAGRQEAELRVVAERNHWNIIEVLEETISGKADQSDRSSLYRAEELASKGKIQKVLIHEVSRLARKPSVAHAFVEAMIEAKVSIYMHNMAIESLMENGRKNSGFGYIFALMAEQANNETSTLGERVKSGMAHSRATKGTVFGRKKGECFSKEKFLGRYPSATAAIKKRPDLSVRELAALADISTKTAHRIKLAMAEP